MHEIEDWVLQVRAARPAAAIDSPWTPEAQAVLDRALDAAAPRRVRRRGPGRVWLGLAATVCAVVFAVLITPFGSSPHRRQLPPPAFGASAADVLDRAAFVALQTGAPPPRRNQYVYSRIEESGGQIVQSWMSVDGTRDSQVGSLRIAGCAHGHLQLSGPGGGRSCTPAPAYFPAMPTTPHGMLGYLKRTQGVRASDVNDLAKVVGSLLDTDYLAPAQQAALFRFLASTRGIKVLPRLTDAAGRSGVGITWAFGRSHAALIFDPRTYAYLGTVTSGVNGQVGGDARLAGGIASVLGRVPGATSAEARS